MFAAQTIYTFRAAYTASTTMLPKRKFVFNTSGLVFCHHILEAVKENCEIIVSPLVDIHFSQKEKKEIGYSVEPLGESEKKYVYKMIRRYLNKEMATNYIKGRRTSHAGEFESIAVAKRLGIPVVIHDNVARRRAKMENVSSLHPIELPETFHHKLRKEKFIEFLEIHCKMKYQPACEKLEKLRKSKK